MNNTTQLKGKTMTTNAHSLANFDPAEYTYHSSQPVQPSDIAEMIAIMGANADAFRQECEEWEATIKAEGVDGNFRSKRTCDHCGAWFKYGQAYRHNPTGKLIVIGSTCAEKRFEQDWGKADVDAYKARLAKLRGQCRIKNAVAAILEMNDGLADALETDHYIVENISHKFYSYGKISDKQIELVYKLTKQVAEENARPEEPKPEAPVTEGRQDLTGTVLCTKVQDSHYGSTIKMLVKLPDHNKVWGTLPTSIECLDHDLNGCTIAFTGTVERSQDDDHFGFFKRPSKARVTLVPLACGPYSD